MKAIEDISSTALPRLAARTPESNKGDYGRGLVVGGSRGMSGAIALAGCAALRSGAGLVTLAVPNEIQNIVASFEPSYMTLGLAHDGGEIAPDATETVLESARTATAVALGPGLGRSPTLTAFVRCLYREISQPMVVDADALFALAEVREDLAAPGGPRILTPHPGEFARLLGKGPEAARQIGAASDEERISMAASLAGDRVVVLLKGHRTVVTDGARASLNATGNPGMATGGTGDVLTGVITGLLCQGLAPFDAARLGAHLHGLAGDLGAERLGQASLIAHDLVAWLPAAFQAFEADR